MAIKTFATGDVLTASDTNTYLANSGLVVITPSGATNGTVSGAKVTIGTTVSSVTVSGVFSSSYDCYRIVVNSTTASAGGNSVYYSQSGSTGSTYYSNMVYMTYSATTVNGSNVNGGTKGHVGITSNAIPTSIVIDVFNPFATAVTSWTANNAGSTYWSTSGGYDSNAASSTGFTLTPNASTFTGGTIMVYGYRLG